MTTARRLTVDAVIKMASTAAQRQLDTPSSAAQTSPELIKALSATWVLVKGRLGQAESAYLDSLISQVIGRRLDVEQGKVGD